MRRADFARTFLSRWKETGGGGVSLISESGMRPISSIGVIGGLGKKRALRGSHLGARAIRGPGLHQRTTFVEQVPAPIGCLGLVLDRMGKCRLAHLVREIRALCCPVSEGGAKAMRRYVVATHSTKHHRQRHVR